MPAGFVRLIAALMGLHACMAVTRVTGVLWLLQQGHSAVLVGGLLALVSLTPALLGAPAGAWSDRFGLWRPLLGGSLCALVGAVACLAWPSVPALAVGALGTGAALGLAAVAVQREIAIVAQHSPVPPQALYSWAAMGPALSNTASPVLAGLVIDHLGFRASFLMAAALAPLGLILLRAARHRPWPASSTVVSLMPAFDLLRSPMLRALLLLNVVFALSWDVHSFVVPVLGHARGYSASAIGLLLGSFALAVFAVRVLIVRFAGRFPDRAALRGALAVCALMLAVYAWLPGMPGMAVGSFLLGLALGSVQPTLLAALTRATPSHRHGQALGLRMLVTNSLSVVLPLTFGVLTAWAGPAAPLWLMAAVAVCSWPATRRT